MDCKMTFKKAVKLLEAKYEKAKNMKYVQKPLAWALYHTWEEVDSVTEAGGVEPRPYGVGKE